jgi:protein required for attachment to host cells
MASGKQNQTCWIVVADGGRARIVVRAAHDRGCETIRCIESVARGKRSAQLGSERPGRVSERASGLRHALEPRTDRHEGAKRQFAAVLAEAINRAGKRGEFGSLLLIAPARQLAAIRKRLAPEVVQSIAGTIAKDLTKTPDSELSGHLVADAMTRRKGAGLS